MPLPKFENGSKPPLQSGAQEENARPIATFIIGCGGHTEAAYFRGLVGARADVQVVDLPPDEDNLSSPRQTVDRVDEFWKRNDIESGDEVWIVLDVDHHFQCGHARGTSVALEQASAQSYAVVFSNPCFEVWLLMHTEEVLAVWPCCDDLVKHLRIKWGRYDKTAPDMDKLRPLVRAAIERGKRSSNLHKTPPANPGTQVHHLLEALDAACVTPKPF